ncbi:adenosyl-hopene transferase HpnH [Chloroflexota bacterium]
MVNKSMMYPWPLTRRLAKYLIGNRLRGNKRAPLVLILEPTLQCNLFCDGCGRVREQEESQNLILSADECLAAIDEVKAPVVCLSGGEPLLHPQIEEIVKRILDRKQFLYLATNGSELKDFLPKISPSVYLNFIVHVDGLAETHNKIVGCDGIFDKVIESIKAAKTSGFRVYTNTTFFRGTDPEEMKQLFGLLTKLKVDGIMLIPAFGYDAVDKDIFLSREEISDIFQSFSGLRHSFRFFSNPIYLQFAAGKKSLKCAPWANPTLSPLGWRQPCYVLTDRYCESYSELMEQTHWDNYGHGSDPRCSNCFNHGAFETSAVMEIVKSPLALWQMLRWNIFS